MRVRATVAAVALIAVLALVSVLQQRGVASRWIETSSAAGAPAPVAPAEAPREPPPHACALVRDVAACVAWYGVRERPARSNALALPVPCVRNCSGAGSCDLHTGVCSCKAGTFGRSCEERSVRECNGATDGLWMASHCVGECDGTTGFCYCPGRVGERPLPDTCQASHLSLDAFAALGLRPDPASPGFSPRDGSVVVAAPSTPRERHLAQQRVEAITRDLLARPEQRANVLGRLWYGAAPGASAAIRFAANASHLPFTAGGRPARPTRAGPPHPEPVYKRISARGTVAPNLLLHKAAPSLGPRPESGRAAWCEAEAAEGAAHTCDCVYDGMHGKLCELRHEPFCLNQCSGHGTCAPRGGRCECARGFFGADCSLTTEGGAIVLHAEHAGRRAPRSPRIFVYELAETSTLLLELRADKRACSHRHFDAANGTAWGGYTYAVEVLLHEQLLGSAHRTASADEADWFYVPVYACCLILPVNDYVGPGPWARNFPMRPVSAMRLFADALQHVRTALPYWNRSAGEDHLFLFAHDEGGCWAPKEIAERATILSHWGRTDSQPDSSSRYMADDWTRDHRTDTRAPSGKRWRFPGGSRSMIGVHPCHVQGRDIVVPVFAPPDKFAASPWLRVAQAVAAEPNATVPLRSALAPAAEPRGAGDVAGPSEPWPVRVHPALLAEARRPRGVLAYFSGNLALKEPLKYARGVRHRLWAAFNRTDGWMLTGSRGGAYSRDLSDAHFCLVPPGGDGWSSRLDDAVRHGCIPVVIMDGVQMPWEEQLAFDEFGLRIAQADIERADDILRAVSDDRRVRMRLAMYGLWLRFVYGSALLGADTFLGAAAPGRLPRRFASQPTLTALDVALGGREGAGGQRGHERQPDAFDTLMMALHARAAARRARH